MHLLGKKKYRLFAFPQDSQAKKFYELIIDPERTWLVILKHADIRIILQYITELLLKHCCHFLPLMAKYFLPHPVLKHPPGMIVPQHKTEFHIKQEDF